MMLLYRIKNASNQRGLTLVEMLIAILLASIIGAGITTLVFQTVRLNASSTNRQIAISQVENAIHYISRDSQQAQQSIPTDSAGNALPVDSTTKDVVFNLVAGEKLKLKWVDFGDNTTTIIYFVENGSLKKTVNGATTMQIATNIDIAAGTWNTDHKTLDIQVRATLDTQQETRTIQIMPRPAQ